MISLEILLYSAVTVASVGAAVVDKSHVRKVNDLAGYFGLALLGLYAFAFFYFDFNTLLKCILFNIAAAGCIFVIHKLTKHTGLPFWAAKYWHGLTPGPFHEEYPISQSLTVNQSTIEFKLPEANEEFPHTLIERVREKVYNLPKGTSNIRLSGLLSFECMLNTDDDSCDFFDAEISICEFPDLNLVDKEDCNTAISQHIFLTCFQPSEIEEQGEYKPVDKVSFSHYSTNHPFAISSYMCDKGDRGECSFLLYLLIDKNTLATFEFKFFHPQRKIHSSVKGCISQFIDSISINMPEGIAPDNLRELPYIDGSEIQKAKMPPVFPYSLKSIYDLPDFFRERAANPIDWHLFKQSSYYQDWITHQYYAHREKFESVVKEYNEKMLATFRVVK